MGRPSKYNPELADAICAEIAAGKSLHAICGPADMPSDATVSGWAIDDIDGFFGKYTRAKQMRCLRYADEIVDIADDSSQDYRTITKNGREIDIPDKEHMMRSALRVDTRKWLMVKYLPKVFGEKQQVDVNVRQDLDKRIEQGRKRVRQG